MKSYRCIVGNPGTHPLVLALTVRAESAQDARQRAAWQVMGMTEETPHGTRVNGWSDSADVRVYHVGGMTHAEVVAIIDAQEID